MLSRVEHGKSFITLGLDKSKGKLSMLRATYVYLRCDQASGDCCIIIKTLSG